MKWEKWNIWNMADITNSMRGEDKPSQIQRDCHFIALEYSFCPLA